jgi:hypothetical protein
MPPAGGGRTRARQRKRVPSPAAYYVSQGKAVQKVANQQRRAARPWRPTKTQLRSALAQRREHVSQGQAVRRVAKVQQVLGPGKAPTVRPYHRRDIAAANRAQDYVNQGKAVEKAANQQRAKRKAEARKLAGQNIGRIQPPTRGVYNPKDVALYAGLIDTHGLSQASKIFKTHKELRDAASKAKALKVLEQVMRPGYASAGGARALVKGKGVGGALKGISRGAQLKDRYLYSDVLKEAGVKNKTVRAVGGFIGDIALDPTTYITFGAGSVAERTAVKAAIRTGEAAARAKARELAPRVAAGTLTRKQARSLVRETQHRMARTTFARRVREATPAQRAPGLTVDVAGGRTVKRAGRAVRRRVLPRAVEQRARRLPPVAPVTRTTASVGRAGQFLAAPLARSERLRTAGRAGRSVAAGAHAGVRPVGASRSEQAQVKAVRREARAEAERLTRRATSRANALVSRLAPDERRAVIDAVEADDLSRLRGAALPRTIRLRLRRDPDRLYTVARQVRDELRYRRRVEGSSGALFSRVGAASKGREEIPHLAQAGRTPRRAMRVQAELPAARKAFAQAKGELRKASTPAARQEARQALLSAGQRLSNLNRRVAGIEAERAQIEAARGGLRTTRRERLAGEAKGYFPHIEAEEVKGPLARLAEPESWIGQRTQPSPVKTREHREGLAAMREGTEAQQARGERFTEDVRAATAQAGARTARKAGAAISTRKLVESFGEPLPQALVGTGPGSGFGGTARALSALREQGKSVYHLKGGELEKLGADDIGKIRRAAERQHAARGGHPTTAHGETGEGGRYVVLNDRVVARVGESDRTPGAELAPLQAIDLFNRGFKSLALKTPGYFVRNLLGDLFNAWGRESAWRLTRELFRGQKALNAIGRLERAERRFNGQLDPKLRTIKLTPEQAREIAGPSAQRLHQVMRRAHPDLSRQEVRALVERQLSEGKVDALGLAQLAERMGVIRQGRFLELMTEGRGRPTRTGGGQGIAKRVEDSVRIGTFLGGLRKGLTAREAATRASDIHFDYGDLTRFEKGVLRRAMPFYTFTSRNLPYQAKTLATRPGKFATVQKAREEARRNTGLPLGYEGDQDEFDARQLGIPIRWGKRVMTVSAGLPFTDLNDVTDAATNPLRIPELATERGAELANPVKIVPELVFNYSTYFREPIEGARPETRAPEWAAWIAQHTGRKGSVWAKAMGLTPDFLDTATGQRTWGWGRKADQFWRSALVGPLRVGVEAAGLGVKSESSRGQSGGQRLAGGLGVRARTIDDARNQLNRLYQDRDQVRARMDRLNQRAHPTAKTPDGTPYPINAEHPTPEYDRLRLRLSAVERAITAGQQRTRKIVKGRPVAPRSGAPRSGRIGARQGRIGSRQPRIGSSRVRIGS